MKWVWELVEQGRQKLTLHRNIVLLGLRVADFRTISGEQTGSEIIPKIDLIHNNEKNDCKLVLHLTEAL